MSHARRFLFYAVNGLGLGHVTRLLAIARQIRRQSADHQIVFLTSSEADSVVYGEGFAAVKLPSKSIRAETGLLPDIYAKLVQSLTWQTIGAFDPHVLVVDTFPTGSLQELLPVLRWPARTAFVYRAQRLERAQSSLLQQALPLYDRIIVPHEPGTETMPMPEVVRDRVRWVGPVTIREAEELLPRDEARHQLGLPPDGRVVFVSLGGGGDKDAAAHFHAVAQALVGEPLTLVLAAGPLYRGTLPEGPHVRRLDRYPLAAHLRAFDLALSAAGYNTSHELALAGVPTVFAPLARGLDDQEDRARRMAADLGGAVLSDWAPDTIRQAVHQVLATTAPAVGGAAPTASGARKAADILLDLAADAPL
jgi:predicted glycosyltransferase